MTRRCAFPALGNHSINVCILPGYEAEGRVGQSADIDRMVPRGGERAPTGNRGSKMTDTCSGPDVCVCVCVYVCMCVCICVYVYTFFLYKQLEADLSPKSCLFFSQF